MKMQGTDKTINRLDYFFTAIAITGVFCALLLARNNSNFPVLLFLSIVFFPLLTFKLVSSILTKETIFSGMPAAVRKTDNSSLYWLVVFTYALFDSLCVIYSIYYIFK
jgi:hypothetical protein